MNVIFDKLMGYMTASSELASGIVGQCWLCGQQGSRQCGCCQTCFTDLPRPPPRNLRPLDCPDYCHTWLAAMYYQPPVEGWVRQFKFHAQPMLCRPYAILVAAQVLAYHRQQRIPLPDYIVPVPMAFGRWQARGYNQAELLAQQLSVLLGIPWKSVLALQGAKQHAGTRQHQLSRTQRMANMNGAYRTTMQIDSGHWVIVDDIITTGATLTSAAQTLIASGADQVSGWALAYTPAESSL